eukprot:TRINITY_DN1849_c0_g1_i6.p1 TRINITY_DN1849_c0_g1~~TRINITY_DN1849_c0_g1_i6.p1  ORF type:complete len:163 (+),score=9.89 TRINITY_DN1849_c0_g1_i6:140-628(+)
MSVNQIAFLVVLFLVVGTSSRSPTSWRHPYSVDPLSNPLFTELLELQAGKYGDLVQNNSLRLSPLAVFNCTLTGRTNPTSAKRLLPGDIDVSKPYLTHLKLTVLLRLLLLLEILLWQASVHLLLLYLVSSLNIEDILSLLGDRSLSQNLLLYQISYACTIQI